LDLLKGEKMSKIISEEFVLKQKPVSCKVFSGYDIENDLIKYIKNFKANKFAIITDSKVKKLHATKFYKKLKSKGVNCEIFSFKEGEKSKNRKVKASIEDEMFKKKFGRDSCVIAFGGGVVGDLAGFIAATYMRGIPVIQVPTTTISVVDSSYGGKTAIDIPAGKNLIGSFHQPQAVFVDLKYLETLDDRNYFSGLVETVKHGLINDKKLFDDFYKNMDKIIDRKNKKYNPLMNNILFRSIKVKQKVVSKDEKENNLRQILNYGHTIGHAVEKLSNFKLLHGEAISIGIVCEGYIAYMIGISDEKTFIKQIEILKMLGLAVKIPKNISTNNIIDIMKVDKKARNAKPKFSLIKRVGKYAKFENNEVVTKIDTKILKKYIDEYKKIKIN
jgi:3-dehydroquinate synthase